MNILSSLSALTITDQATDVPPSQGVDTAYFKWNHHQDLLLQEILNSRADIIALEKMDHFHDIFSASSVQCMQGLQDSFLPNQALLVLTQNQNPTMALMAVHCSTGLLFSVATGQTRQISLCLLLQVTMYHLI